MQLSGTSDNRWIGPLDRIIGGCLLSPFVTQTITSFTVRPNREDLEFLGALIESGKVIPVIDRTYSLADIHNAIRRVEEGPRQRQGRPHRHRHNRRRLIQGAHVP